MTEQEMREIFREMRDEPVPVDSLARARASVDRRSSRRSWWKLVGPLVAAACIVAGFFLLRPARTPVPIEPQSTPEIAQVRPPPEPPVQSAPRPRRARRPQTVESVPVSIRIETPDPDVVILLVN